VVKVERDNAYVFARIACEPMAGIEQHGLVLALESRAALPMLPSGLLAPEKAKSEKPRSR
jgi:rod shape-determining protein MreC